MIDYYSSSNGDSSNVSKRRKRGNQSLDDAYTRMPFCLAKLSVRDNDQFDREKKLEIVVLSENNKTNNLTRLHLS